MSTNLNLTELSFQEMEGLNGGTKCENITDWLAGFGTGAIVAGVLGGPALAIGLGVSILLVAGAGYAGACG